MIEMDFTSVRFWNMGKSLWLQNKATLKEW